MIITLCRRGALKNIRFVLRIEHFVLQNANISFCGLYRAVKIKLSDEDKQFASSCDDLEELVEALSEVHHFSLVNSQWMALDEYKEDSFGF